MIISWLLVLLLYFTRATCNYCPTRKTITLSPYGRPISCHSSSDCPMSSKCFLISGYCCEDLTVMAPECPQEMIPVKISQNKLLQCKMTDKTTCPNGSVCVPSSIPTVGHCCAPDPSEGCAVGSRALRKDTSKEAILCSPSTQRKADTCPGESSCQWNFNLKQYQCCEPDDGCPRSHRPMLDEHSVVRACDPSKNINCPRGGVCWYNFWHGKFQCCQPIAENLCPANMVVFLSPDGPISCNSDSECPEMYKCQQNICCGHPGACPRPAHSPARDEHGRLRPCFAPSFVDCPGDSSCEPSIYPMVVRHAWKQQLCCAKTVLTCADGGSPYPSNKDPMPCDKSKIDSCPVDTKCRASNVPKTFICCRTKILSAQLCPKGWILENNQLKYCKPNSNDCSNSCLLSSQTRQFICCSPLMRAQSRLKQLSLVTSLDRDYTCPLQYVGPEILNRQERQCFSPGTRGECSAGFICATSLEDGNVNICCGPSDNQRDESRFRCPNPGQIEVLENGRNRFCDAYSNDCPRLSTCQSALNSYQMMICCFSATSETPLCPADSIPQPSTAGFVPCDLNRGNQCDNGYICIPSANQPQSSVCCSRVNSNAHICPNQQSLYLDNGRPRICTPQQINPCPTGFTCSQSVANSGTYICCSLPTTATCPVSYTVVIGVNGPIHCNVNNQNDCPADSQCLRSPNQVQSAVCCQSSNAPRVCPEGMSALLLPNNQIERCTGPGSTCPVSGYTCQLSNSLSAWVCCGHGRSQVLCQNGDVPYSQQFGTPFRCNLFAFPSECPVNYVCQSSSQANTNVCCPSNSPGPNPTPEPFPPFEPTLRPPAADLTCPTGWSPFEDSEGAYHFCQHPLDRQCPQGFSCAQSSVSGVFVCCRLASNLQCSTPNITPYIINNAPRLCTLSNTIPNPCPLNFSCQPSNVAQVHICCPINSNIRPLPAIQINRPVQSSYYGNQIMCMDGSIPAYVGQEMVQCNYLNTPDCCPPTYICALSTQRGINVCCHSQLRSSARLSSRKEVRNICPEDSILVPDGDNQCFDSRECPGTSTCHPEPNEIRGHCCQQLECNEDYSLRLPTQRCVEDGECGENGKCQGVPGLEDVRVCCIPNFEKKHRCLGRGTFLHSGHSIFCTANEDCPAEHECSNSTTTGSSICCASSKTHDLCPENRIPYRNVKDDQPIKCAVTELSSACPTGYVCKTGPSGDSFCCSFIAFCPPGKVPDIDERLNHARRCRNSSDCAPGYSCGPSSVELIQICCSSKTAFNIRQQSQTDDYKLWTIMEG